MSGLKSGRSARCEQQREQQRRWTDLDDELCGKQIAESVLACHVELVAAKPRRTVSSGAVDPEVSWT
jgi:hypothetical protein